jgi:hypothetical protein
MERLVSHERWIADIDGPQRHPQICLSPRPGIDPSRRGLTVYEFDWQRMVKLSAAEALELLRFLKENEALLAKMAREDEEALIEAGRHQAERSWQAAAVAAPWENCNP